jgi:putative transposase
MAVVVATGITADGGREVLGLNVGDSEDEVFWRGFLSALKRRGLTGVRLVISDQHAGLVAALKRSFQGTAHQRCRVHFARNLLAHVPKTHTDMVAAVFRTIFAQPDAATVAATWDEVRDQLGGRFPKIGTLMDAAKADVLAFTAFPDRAGQDLEHQPARASEQGDQTPGPGGRRLPQRGGRHSARRRDPGRHARRVAIRRAPLPVRGIHGPTPTNQRYWRHRRDRQRRIDTEDQPQSPPLRGALPSRRCLSTGQAPSAVFEITV